MPGQSANGPPHSLVRMERDVDGYRRPPPKMSTAQCARPHPDEAGWRRVAGWWRRLRAGERPVLHLQFDPERCAPRHGATIFFETGPGI